jgi:DNA-binding response OmpR family regulator
MRFHISAKYHTTVMPSICVIGESDPFVAHLLQRFAEKSGLDVKRAGVSQDFMSLVRTYSPAVVIVDAELPGDIIGWETIRILRCEEKTSGLPVISCSWVSKEKATELMGPLAGYMQKPELHYEDFLASLQNAGLVTGNLKKTGEH